MSGDEKSDFLTEMMAQQAPAEVASEADDAPESDVPETVETPVVESEATAPEAKPAAVAPTAPPEEKTVPIAAMMDERRKRQELEARLKALESQPPEAVEAPNFYDNPEAHIASVVSTVEQRANQRMYAALEFAAKQQHPDYDEVTAEVIEAAQLNPMLVQTVMQAANPALAMYEQGMKIRQMREMQDPAAYKAKLRDEILAEVRAELGAQGEQAAAAQAAREARANAIPPDISGRTNAAPKANAEVANPVDSLFPKTQ